MYLRRQRENKDVYYNMNSSMQSELQAAVKTGAIVPIPDFVWSVRSAFFEVILLMQQGKRRMLLFLVLSLLIQCVIVLPIETSAATSAEASGKLILGEGTVGYVQTLEDNGTYYTLTLALEDASDITDLSQDSSVSRNGYFTAPAAGEYLVELWGGDGGSGGPGYGDALGGNGGNGGHVYGIVTLEEGETLYYVLGGNGQQTISEENGGGVNGDGGNAGTSTTYTVGGGGGYSAVFKFAPGEFESKYLDSDGNLASEFISEADRTSKHIMIAGGGGGGGAGSGSFLFSDEGNQPNGGDGGSVGSLSGTVADGGTFFAGQDGQTSGTSTDYTGKGATYLPGEVLDTFLSDLLGLGWFDGLQPNDWTASYNTGYPGGNGGAGDLRGGAGGAGYAGGSGGVQTSVVIPTNVGGGGGGSSYVAQGVDYQREGIQELLHKSGNDESAGGSAYGGMVYITALNTGTDSYFNNVALSFTPSKYFEVTASDANGTLELTPEDSDGDGKADSYSLSGIDLTGTETVKTVRLIFTPKTEFAGGNGVPLLEGNALTITGAGTDEAGTEVTHSNPRFDLDPECAMVNVPLRFRAVAKSTETNAAGTEVSVSNLYDASTLPADLSGWQYDYISAVSSVYEVYEMDGTKVTGDTVAPRSTTNYRVGYTVTPKSGTVAVVGDPAVETFVSAIATVRVKAAGYDYLNGNKISYEKALNYRDYNGDGSAEYVLSFVATAEANKTLILDEIPVEQYEYVINTDSEGTQVATHDYQYQVPASGYYFIQAWGGDGGKGGDNSSNSGGHGGIGAYLEGYVYLNKGDSLMVTIGKKGNQADTVGYADASGGAGGDATWVNATIENTVVTLLVAGGGGGGGGAQRGWFSGHNGLGRTETTTKLTNDCAGMFLNGYIMEDALTSVIVNQNTAAVTDVANTDFNGKAGATGDDSDNSIGNNAKAGNAGPSYVNGNYIGKLRVNQETGENLALTEAAKAIYENMGIHNHRGTTP